MGANQNYNLKKFELKAFSKIARFLFMYASDDLKIKAGYLLRNLTPSEHQKDMVERVIDLIKENGPLYALIKRGLSLNKKSVKRFVDNVIVEILLSNAKNSPSDEFRKKYGYFPPEFLLISPTMRCNLKCIGCSTRKYDTTDIPIQILRKVLKEAREMGMHFVVTLGGEPFIRPEFVNLCGEFKDIFFQYYTNGTLINEKMAKKIAKLGNIAPMFSVEGFEKETDERRGKGVYKKIMQTMDMLRNYKIPYGFSVTATRKNAKTIVSDKFIEFMIKKGCVMGWYFQYIPVGDKPDVSLMPTPEQRMFVNRRTKEIRLTKPIFLGDFWGDGPFVGGCVAGRKYIHINNDGNIEPCGFVHFATDNIKDVYKRGGNLKEALNSQFFRMIRERQQAVTAKKRFSDNLLTPCMVIDQPQVLRKICRECKAYGTHEGAETIIKDKKIMKHLDSYSKKLHKLADKEWDEKYSKERIELFKKIYPDFAPREK